MKLTPPAALSATSWRITTTSPLTVQQDGQATQLRARTLASYTPAVGDVVAVIALDTSKLLVLGKIV